MHKEQAPHISLVTEYTASHCGFVFCFCCRCQAGTWLRPTDSNRVLTVCNLRSLCTACKTDFGHRNWIPAGVCSLLPSFSAYKIRTSCPGWLRPQKSSRCCNYDLYATLLFCSNYSGILSWSCLFVSQSWKVVNLVLVRSSLLRLADSRSWPKSAPVHDSSWTLKTWDDQWTTGFRAGWEQP